MKKLFLALLVLSLVLAIGCSSSDSANSTSSNIPSGNDCAENVAYLQAGVDKYKAALGEYPLNVDQLLETKDNKGPFVEVVPKCPTGNQYVIDNGVVKEAPKQ